MFVYSLIIRCVCVSMCGSQRLCKALTVILIRKNNKNTTLMKNDVYRGSHLGV